MGSFISTGICCVRNCGRRPKSENEFCEKCWSQLEDGERSGYLFALHAPFWRRANAVDYVQRHDGNGWDVVKEEDEEGDFVFVDPTMPPEAFSVHVNNGHAGITFFDTTTGKRAAGMTAGHLLREYEHRTTRDAISAALWDRRWRESVIGQTPAPSENP